MSSGEHLPIESFSFGSMPPMCQMNRRKMLLLVVCFGICSAPSRLASAADPTVATLKQQIKLMRDQEKAALNQIDVQFNAIRAKLGQTEMAAVLAKEEAKGEKEAVLSALP